MKGKLEAVQGIREEVREYEGKIDKKSTERLRRKRILERREGLVMEERKIKEEGV